jgi:oxygen-independent coproporphyrinogen III oxidase
MAGIYIHIPFCRRKCHYCNFYSVASSRYRKEFMEGITEEIYLRRNYMDGKEVQTLYFGGGTPSYMAVADIQKILDEIRKYQLLSSDAEITLEANPDDINPALLKAFKEAGINRLSIGIQSFRDEDLHYLNRVHSAARAEESIREAMDTGFENLSIDLIYGIPTLTSSSWERNLDRAIALGIPHISAYSLTVEPDTALDVLIHKKKLAASEEDNAIEHFRILLRKMKEHGYEHYEISNFCKPGMYSRHNRQYWNGESYLGLGPSAHSYNGHSRQWNVGSIIQYADQIRRNDRFFETEELTPAQHYNEFVMVSLRTMWGCDLSILRRKFGETLADDFSKRAMKYISNGKMNEEGGIYTLKDEGKLFADGIASDLFMES